MNINLENRLYKIGNAVYIGYNQINVHNQRGRLFIKRGRNKQVNIKDIPVLPEPEIDPVFDYVFGGGFVLTPCHAMDYFIARHRMKLKISVQDYKSKFLK